MAAERRLKSPSDIRRYLAYLITRTERGELEPSLAGKLGYLSQILLKAVEASDLSDRLTKIEEKIKNEKR
jgi:hypothetical protein